MTIPAALRWACAALAVCLLSAPARATERPDPQVLEELLDLSLEELLQVKISTAAKYEQLAADAPASVTLVTAEDIALYGYRNLAEVLRHAAGFYTGDDRNYTYLGVRGFSRPTDYNNRVLLLLDGHPLNESIFGQALLANETPLDMGSIQQVEIVRGPGSALYGSYAMFAVVNVVTRKGGPEPEARLTAEGGSWGRREVSALYSRQLGGAGLHLSGRWGEMEGDVTPQDCATMDVSISSNRRRDTHEAESPQRRRDHSDSAAGRRG
jgi:iron complex outermembrane receptor protein